MKQQMMGWQWHISLQTDNHASTSPHIFYRLDALSDAKPTVQSIEGKMLNGEST